MNGILDQTETFGIENTRVSGTLKALFQPVSIQSGQKNEGKLLFIRFS